MWNILAFLREVCPSDWKMIRGRCIYNSFDFGKTISTWNEASAKCQSLSDGATLVSIRDKTDQQLFAGSIH